MNVADILAPEDVVLDLRAPDKRRLIEELARRAAALAGLEPAGLAEALMLREGLGSTGMGSGIAIPHARLPSVARPRGLFARLRPAVDFDAIDGERVDLVFLLLLPAQAQVQAQVPGQGDQLNALACVARRLRAEGVKAALRRAHVAEQLFAALAHDGEG